MKVAINFANPFKFDIKSTRGMSPNEVSVIPEISDFSVSLTGNVRHR